MHQRRDFNVIRGKAKASVFVQCIKTCSMRTDASAFCSPSVANNHSLS